MINAREVGVAPSKDEVEVTLLGPGYGESIVVHFGQGEWIIVDSCINDAREPQALEYLRAIGVEPDEAVSLIVATHWHDDHIRGMAKVVEGLVILLYESTSCRGHARNAATMTVSRGVQGRSGS